MVWMRMAPTGSHVEVLDPSLVGRSRWEGLGVEPCWARCVTRARLAVSQDVSLCLLLRCQACLPAAMLHAVMVVDPNPLKL